MQDQCLHEWLLLYFQKLIPPSPLYRLLNIFETPRKLLSARCDSLQAEGLAFELAEKWQHLNADEEIARRCHAAMHWHHGAPDRHIVSLHDPFYPPLLREIHDPPLLLFVRGEVSSLLNAQIAIVGSRGCSHEGKRNAQLFAEALAVQGFSICSGLARGIDTQAHLAALMSKGLTVGVLGTGVDVCYPKSNLALMERIIANGAVISELPLGSQAFASHFPQRNRIISGMSLGVIVVEAAMKSGSLITARLAMEQNREVFAVPGSIRNPLSEGSHRLIQQGALLTDTPQLVVSQIESLLTKQMSLIQQLRPPQELPSVSARTPTPLDAVSQKIIKAIGYDPVSMEDLLERTQLPLSALQQGLLELELAGHIYQQNGLVGVR